jgi:hypothetical protein
MKKKERSEILNNNFIISDFSVYLQHLPVDGEERRNKCQKSDRIFTTVLKP